MIRRHPLPALFASSLLLVVGSLIALRAQPPDFDLLIAGGRIVDGSGAPWFYADVGIKGDRIAAIGQLKAATATTRVDAAGLVVAPGFIDMLGQSEFNVLVDGRAASKVTMGVTTEVTGEGASIADAEFEAAGATTGTRSEVLKDADAILCVTGPEPGSLKGAKSGALLIGALDPARRGNDVQAYGAAGIEALAGLDVVIGAPELAIARGTEIATVGELRALQPRFALSIFAGLP